MPMNQQSKDILRAALDPMCVPQVDDPFRDKGQTFAQSLQQYIDWVVNPTNKTFNDTDSSSTIY